MRFPFRCVVPLLSAALAIAAPVAGITDERKASPTPPAIERPNWGKVTGWVLDATTRKPISGARVIVEVDGAFPTDGKSADLSDKTGRFDVKAPLGRISTKVDWGRILSMSPLSMILSPRSVTKQTRLLDVTQVNARIEAVGYKPFLGRVRAMQLNPSAFSITLDDVWLAPASSGLASFTPERLRNEAIDDFQVVPAVAGPGEKVRIRLVTTLPLDRGYKYRAHATSTAIRVVDAQVELKAEKPESGAQGLTFSREVTLPKSSIDRWTELGFFMVRDGTVTLRQRDTRTLLQIVKSPEERSAAEKVAEGFAQYRAGNRDAALERYAAAGRERPEYALPFLLEGELYLQLSRPKDAAAAFHHLMDLDPRDYETARPRYAQTQIETGDPKGALVTLADAEKTLGKQRIPAGVFLNRARAQAALGDFLEADRWLTRAGERMEIPADIQAEINRHRMSAAVKTKPNDVDLRLSYARVLDDSGQREEAIAETRRAVELDSQNPWSYLDLGSRLREAGRTQEALSDLQRAIQLAPDNTAVMMGLADVYRDLGRFSDAIPLYRKVVEAQSLNLRARHFYSLMLYATGQRAEAEKQFAEIINQARDKGELKDKGIPFIGPGVLGSDLYFGPKKRLVFGFSVPEAAADAILLECLQQLEQHHEDALVWQNTGAALLDLDLPALALTALEKSREQDPTLLETRFLLGVAFRRLGKTDLAQAELALVIAGNPLHPRARLELAQLYTDLGELEQAQAQLLAHQKNYPWERPAPPTRGLGG